jgi:lipopolysaccharide export LptBFGC system permease protein LptF
MALKARLFLLRNKFRAANRRLIIAMSCYCMIALAALFALLPARSSDEQFLLGLVLFVIGFLAIKTLVHSQDE